MTRAAHFAIHQEEDRPNVRFVVFVAIATGVLFSIGIAWSTLLMNAVQREVRPAGPAPVPKVLGEAEIGIVDQPMFDRDRRLSDERDAKKRRLETYGWVDRANDRVHLPIGRAMQLVASGVKP